MTIKTLLDYEQLIKDLVKKIDEEDTNWRFYIKSISKEDVKIGWTYLDYCECSTNYFTLALTDYDEEFDDYSIFTRDHNGTIIEGYFATTTIERKKSWATSFESALTSAINEIAYYAHTRY